MKKIFYLAFLLFAIASCKDPMNEKGTITLHFIPKYGNQTLVMQEKVKTKEGYALTLQRLSFFTQVQNGNAKENINGNEVALINFSDLTDKTKAETGISAVFSIDKGTYNTLDLGIGIPPSLNKKKPSDFSSSNPLSEEGDYWESWNSYIFTKTEGKVDTADVDTASFGFSYHTGTDEMFRNVSLPQSFTINSGQNTDMSILLDVNEIFNGQSGTINPLIEQNAHSLSNKVVALKISDNYKTALKVK